LLSPPLHPDTPYTIIKQKDHEVKENPETKLKDEINKTQSADEEVDIDLKDPEVEKAALKIQATFKGLKMRKAKRITMVRL